MLKPRQSASPQWVCVRTQPHRESFAEANLTREGLDVYCPRYERWLAHARYRKVVKRPLFPNYLFVRSSLGLDGLGAVKRTPGVSALASHDLTSAIVPEAVIEALRGRENPAGSVELDEARFCGGDAVRIISGPFANFEAIFAEKHDDRRCRILLSLLGKQHSLLTLSHFLEKVA